MKILLLSKRQRGAALPMVLMVLVVFSILGVSLASYVSRETKTAKETETFLKTRYIAEAGVEMALFQIKKNIQNIPYDYNWTLSSGFPTYLQDTILPQPLPAGQYYDLNLHTDATNDSDTYSYPFTYNVDGSTTPDTYSDTFKIKGRFRWDYADNNLADNQNVWWILNTTPVTRGTTFPPMETNKGSVPPSQIEFHKSFIGTGQIYLPDGSVYTRKIKVGATFTFVPQDTPDAPVYITMTQWEDLYN